MSKSMLINVILEEESRVAIVDNGVLDFFEIEIGTSNAEGEIYKGLRDVTRPRCRLPSTRWEDWGLPRDESFRVFPLQGTMPLQDQVTSPRDGHPRQVSGTNSTTTSLLSTDYSLRAATGSDTLRNSAVSNAR